MTYKIVQITALDSTMKGLLGRLNEEVLKEGYEVHCICSPGEDIAELKALGYKMHPINIDRQISPISNIKSIIKIASKLKEINPDIVHVHTPIAAVLGRVAAKLAGVQNIIYTAHGFYFHEGMSRLKYNLFFNIEKYFGRYFTDYIFTQSEEDYNLAKKSSFLSQKNKDNYLHISNGIDIDHRFNVNKFSPVDINTIYKELGIPSESIVVTFIGRLVKEKGILDLLKAMTFLPYDTSVSLIVMGSIVKSERDHSLQNFIENNTMTNIHFIGRVTNVEKYLYASDIFILPSYREGMPRSIIEGMAMSNAIIATNIRGSREEVLDGYNGFLIDTGSPHLIAEKIIDLANNQKLLRNMQSNGIKEVQSKYNERNVVKKQIDVFNTIVGK